MEQQVQASAIRRKIFALFSEETREKGFPKYFNYFIMQIKTTSGSVVKESACNAGDTQETWVQSLGQEDPLEKEMATYSIILACEILESSNDTNFY